MGENGLTIECQSSRIFRFNADWQEPLFIMIDRSVFAIRIHHGI